MLSSAAAERQTAAAASLLLIGDAAGRPPDYPALKYAAAEMANISRHFPPHGVAAFQGVRASPAAYASSPPDRFTYVHFTAHASANLESPLDSAVILSGPEGAYKLYARDVAALPLHAELVTVSACRSAGARAYSGEGLVGFRLGLSPRRREPRDRRAVGRRRSIDRRPDGRLYAGVAAGDTASHALRDAKLAMLAHGGNYAKPYYWGPFQLFTVVP